MIQTESATGTGRKKKVLVVDDEHDFLSLMDFFLTLEGFDVETVCDGVAAIESVERGLPDLILLDVIMPRMDGYQALHTLRNNAKTRDIPVIMLSILDKSDLDTEDLAVTDYLVKPFSTTELIERIRTTLTA